MRKTFRSGWLLLFAVLAIAALASCGKKEEKAPDQEDDLQMRLEQQSADGATRPA